MSCDSRHPERPLSSLRVGTTHLAATLASVSRLHDGDSLPRLTTYIAVAAAKTARLGSRLLRAGSGTTLPGLVAERIDPSVIAELSASLPDGVIVVTGTNGKTTTAKMLTEILVAAGKRVLTNESGSNLTRGVASTLVQASRGLGLRIDADVAVFEIDEATMADRRAPAPPSRVVVTNLFRDQLDRYGELDKTAAIIGGALDRSTASPRC